jgi:hypothetical protein
MWFLDVWTKGIDWGLPGNGGPDCLTYLSAHRQIMEFFAGLFISLMAAFIGYRLHTQPSQIRISHDVDKLKSMKKWSDTLCVLMSITYLLEIGYKVFTNQAVFIFSPCHCLCLVQMFILRQLSKSICDGMDQDDNNILSYSFR